MSDTPSDLQFEINGVPFNVRVLDVIADNDPDAVGCIIYSQAEIQILRGQSLPSAFGTLAHEVGHAWLGRHPEERLPTSIESFCESFADVMPKFVAEFARQGGHATLAEMMGLPHEGNETALSLVPWLESSPSDRQTAVIRHVHCWDLTDLQFEQYRVLYEAAGLNPLLGDCYARKSVKNGKRIAIELGTTIKAMRRVAHRSGVLDSISRPEWAGEDGVFVNVWPTSKGRPMFAQVSVKRTDKSEPFWGVARWDSFVQTVVIDGREVLDPFWDKMDDHMLAKCSESLALAKAFTQLDGLALIEAMRSDVPSLGQAATIERRGKKFVREERLDEQLEELSDPPATSHTALMERDSDAGGDDEEPSSDADLHQTILRVSSLVRRAKREELIREMRDKWAGAEDDNREAFKVQLYEEAKRRWGGGR